MLKLVKGPMSNHDVYRRLKAAILGLEFGPGHILQEQQIGDLYGASRTPAREALRALMSEGLIVKSGKFYVVKSFGLSEVRELYEVRQALESLSVRLATRNASNEDLVALKDHMIQHMAAVAEAAPDQGTTDGSYFHLTIARLSGNSMLRDQLTQLHDKVIFLSHLVDARHRSEFIASLDDHMRIVEAMIRRNEAVAAAEIEAHLRWGATMALQYLQESAPSHGLAEQTLVTSG